MIGYISGKVKIIIGASTIVDVDGVGYKLEIAGIEPMEGNEIELFVHTHVREQELRLFGFKTSDELEIFERLLSVSGVGPKVALALISELGVNEIVNAVKLEKPEELKVTGVGIKTAEKIVVELKDKFDLLVIDSSGDATHSKSGSKLYGEALEALNTLGFKTSEAASRIKGLIRDNPKIKSASELIKEFLKK
ncbi:MAG TPA: Holliday junction branch migration protein RuvA [bacterium]|nr:Holliday junction branch migration protein RuvA [bacterium]